ncbi:MAG TPA: SDR family NAD(P)-dependent oxidoreductase [Acidimicrobiia bacterium]|jgi:NAD(P)-dependent dehydrogenase (short-subunit alcohol dehydrogenase family)
MGELDGRVALVTGASRGIGAATARRLAAEGAVVAVTARTVDEHPGLPGSLRETVATIEADGGRAVAVAADLADGDDRARIVGDVQAQLGPVDVLVNNAAAAFYLPIDEFSLKRRRILFELNFHAPVDLAVAVLPGMRASGAGWIVNVSSATSQHPHGPPFRRGSEPTATATIYGASKAALERFTTGLAAEVHGDNIAVNALSPVAAVRTPGADALVAGIMDARPELVEPVELMAEATLALATCDPATCTGRIVLSRPFLGELGRAARNLDGSPRPDGTVA